MKKKVLFLIESLSGGGAEKVLSTIIQNINKDKFDVTVCSIVNIGVYVEEIKANAKYKYLINYDDSKSFSLIRKLKYYIKYKLIYNYLPSKWVYKLFIPKDFDVEVAFVEGFATKILSASTNKKSKKYAWVHIDLINNHWTDNIYASISSEKKSYSKYNLIIGVSNTVSNSVRRLFGLNHVKTLYNPINSNAIIKAAKSTPTIQINASNKLRLISIGRFVPQKGYDRLIKIAQTLYLEGIDFELWLLGDGPDRNIYQSFILENHLDDIIHMPGFVTNPYSIMSNCDLFVCSSRSEGYSTVVTEALILGIPVITTNCSGMEELLNYGEYGIITDNNESALYAALRNLLLSEEKLLHYKQKASERGKDFKLEMLMQSIETLLIQ